MPWGTSPSRSRSPRPAPPRGPQLQVVPRTARAGANRFLVLVAGLLIGGLIGLLLLNLSMQKGAFELAAIESQTETLRTQEQELSYEMQRLGSTDHLKRRATNLGMVHYPNPVFLNLADGSIIGDPVPAEGVPEPVVADVLSTQDRTSGAGAGAREGRPGQGEQDRTTDSGGRERQGDRR